METSTTSTVKQCMHKLEESRSLRDATKQALGGLQGVLGDPLEALGAVLGAEP